ncbi:MAG: helix-turn-helix domain-containing protein [Clostridia bacterium]|nr:helix-turn-helix domain-containing protein [Clostridia bacterium]
MHKFKILSIPHVEFAHSFGTDQYEYPMSIFENVIEIAYLTEGELHITRGEETYIAKKGDVLSLCYLEKMTLKTDAYHHHETVSMRVKFVETDEDGDDVVMLPLVITDTDGHCQTLIEEIIRTNAMFPEQKLRCSGMCLELLNEIGEAARRNRLTKNSQGNLHMIRAKKYIYRHLHEPIRQRDIASYLGITPEYLSSLFRKNERSSVMAFINRMKLNEIFALMRKEGLPLNKAASLYGFPNPHYVSRLFKKYYGVSISEAKERVSQAQSERRIWNEDEE